MFISCGDPAKGPATYTRFILPFAYCLTPHKPVSSNKKSSNDIFYEEKPPDDLIWRKKYLTHETSDVLFRRAKWFTLKDSRYPLKIDMNFRDCGENDFITINIKSPELILFESPKPEDKKKACKNICKDPSLTQCFDDEHNILRTGFLVLELYFPERNHKCPCLDNLLELNELFRYWQQPFKGHEDKIYKKMGYKKLLGKLPFIYMGYNLKVISLKSPDALPEKGSKSVIVAKINGFYHIRIFDKDGEKVIDSGKSKFLPGPTLVQKLDEALRVQSNGKQIGNKTKDELIEEILLSLSLIHPLALYFERWASLLEIPISDEQVSDGQENHWHLFPEKWGENAREFVSGEKNATPGWAIYPDNRTFVWTCAIMEGAGNALKEEFNKENGKASEFGHWIKLLNVDQPGKDFDDTNNSTCFEKEWAEERTYKRWEQGGTFYGFNYHSGAMLGPPFKEPPLSKHFGQMYFDQIVLLLYIRLELFRFSMRLNRISTEALERESGDYAEWLEEFQKLRESFTLFTNLYQFPFLSNQQQAIEMYSLARKHMDIDDLFKEVQQEVNSNHEYLSTKEATRQANTTTRLTVVATVGLILAIATGFLGMNIIVEDKLKGSLKGSLNSWEWGSDWLVLLLTVVVFTLITIVIVWKSNFIGKCLDWISTKKRKQ